MIAQLLLTALLMAILLYSWIAYRKSPAVALLSFLASLAGLYLVWLPNHASTLAHWIGIGRGVDLVLYVWVGISLILLLNLHLKLRAQMEVITQLARAIALANALPSRRGQEPPRPQSGD